MQLLVTNGQEYLEPENIDLPSGQVAAICGQNPEVRDEHHDAFGIEVINEDVLLTLADGVGKHPGSKAVAGTFIRQAHHHAKNADRPLPSPYNLNQQAAHDIERASQEGTLEKGATVGASFWVFPELSSGHTFGDTEVGVYKASSRRLNVPGHPNFAPQKNSPFTPTSFIGTHRSILYPSSSILRLQAGDWLILATDGISLDEFAHAFENWINDGMSPREVAAAARQHCLEWGTDNFTGVFYRRG